MVSKGLVGFSLAQSFPQMRKVNKIYVPGHFLKLHFCSFIICFDGFPNLLRSTSSLKQKCKNNLIFNISILVGKNHQMWRNTEKAESHKSVEWEMFESKHFQNIWLLKKYNTIIKIFTPCFINTKAKK